MIYDPWPLIEGITCGVKGRRFKELKKSELRRDLWGVERGGSFGKCIFRS
jgi:hypothetical protein